MRERGSRLVPAWLRPDEPTDAERIELLWGRLVQRYYMGVGDPPVDPSRLERMLADAGDDLLSESASTPKPRRMRHSVRWDLRGALLAADDALKRVQYFYTHEGAELPVAIVQGIAACRAFARAKVRTIVAKSPHRGRPRKPAGAALRRALRDLGLSKHASDFLVRLARAARLRRMHQDQALMSRSRRDSLAWRTRDSPTRRRR
jgi:hypothetical protein